MEQHIIWVPIILHITQLHPNNTSDPIESIKYSHTLNSNHKGVQRTMLCYMISPYKKPSSSVSNSHQDGCAAMAHSMGQFINHR
jgi:hypothetical protein